MNQTNKRIIPSVFFFFNTNATKLKIPGIFILNIERSLRIARRTMRLIVRDNGMEKKAFRVREVRYISVTAGK